MHLSSTLFLLPLLPLAHAWGVVGHEIVATIAQIHLFPETKQAIKLLVPSSGHLAPIAAWADRVSTLLLLWSVGWGWAERLPRRRGLEGTHAPGKRLIRDLSLTSPSRRLEEFQHIDSVENYITRRHWRIIHLLLVFLEKEVGKRLMTCCTPFPTTRLDLWRILESMFHLF